MILCATPVRTLQLLLSTILSIVFPCAGIAQVQMFLTSGPDSSEYPRITAQFFLIDENGLPKQDLERSDIRVTENGTNRRVLDISCPNGDSALPLSSVLTIDASISMANPVDGTNPNGLRRIDLVRAGALAWIDGFNFANSECALTSFNDRAYLDQDLTSDGDKLRDAVNSISLFNATSYDSAFLGSVGGGLTVAARGSMKRVMIFLTDGEVNVSTRAIIDTAMLHDITIYCIVIKQPANSSLRQIAQETGGLYFERVGRIDEIRAIYQAIYQHVSGVEPCTLAWESATECSRDREVRIEVPEHSAEISAFYRTPPEGEGKFLFDRSRVAFGAVRPGTSREFPLVVRFLGDDVNVADIVPDDPRFSVVELESDPDLLPVRLRRGDLLSLTLRYTPTDTLYRTTAVRFLTNGCNDTLITCSGGYFVDPTNRAPVRLIHPNGGEEFLVGSDTVITWDGILPSDPVRLEYSENSGLNWKLITENATGFSHPWTAPLSTGDRYLARVTQMNPDIQLVELDHPEPVLDLRFFNDGSMLVTLDDAGVLRGWNTNDGSLAFITGSTGAGSHLEVSPDGRLAAAAGGIDGNVHVWDLVGGARKYQLYAAYPTASAFEQGLRGPMAFTPDGTGLIVSKVDVADRVSVAVRTLRLYDMATGNLRREITDTGFGFRFVTFSRDGSRFAAGGRDGNIAIWDGDLSRVTTRLRDPNGDVIRLSFSRDGRRITSLAEGPDGAKTVSFWEISSESVIRSEPVGSGTVDIDAWPSGGGNRVLIAGNEAIVRDLQKGEVDRIYIGHTADVNTGRFSDDGTLVATGSDDLTARLWKIDAGYARADESDSLWSVVDPGEPKFSGRDIEFPGIRVGSSRDSTLTDYIRNLGPGTVTVDDIRVIGPHRQDFTLIQGIPPFDLAPGTAHDIGLNFRPGGLGLRQATLLIETNYGTIEQDLRGTGLQSQLRVIGLAGDRIDFGKVNLGRSRDSVAVLVNSGTASLRIESIGQTGPDAVQFSTLGTTPTLPVDLGPSDTLRVSLRFAPNAVGQTQGGVELRHDGDDSPAFVELLGEGIGTFVYEPEITGPTTLQFDDQKCEASEETGSITISNVGTADLEIESIDLGGSHPGDFSLSPLSFPITILPGESTDIDVTFLPTDEGPRSAELTIISNAVNEPAHVVALIGTYSTIRLTVSDERIDLGRLCPGTTLDPTLLIGNLSSTDTELDLAVVIDPGSVGTVSGVPSVLPLEGAEERSVRFSFDAGFEPGTGGATLTFTDPICGSTLSTRVEWSVGKPTVSVDSVPVVCSGSKVRLFASGADRYEWIPNPDLSCIDCADPVVTPGGTDTYYVVGTDAYGCTDTAQVTVRVREKGTVLNAAVGRDYRATAGDTVVIGVDLITPQPAWSDIRELLMRLRYDPGVMVVDPQSIGDLMQGTLLQSSALAVSDQGNGSLLIRFSIPDGTDLAGTGTLFRFRSRIFLASAVGSEIDVEIESDASCLQFETAPGYVRVDSLCGLTNRLFELGMGKYALGESMRNPVFGSEVAIPFSLGLDGDTELQVFDRHGVLVGTLMRDHLEAGAHSVLWDASGVPTGQYLLRLRSGAWEGTVTISILH